MSNVGSNLLECPDVQAELDSEFLTCDPATLHRESQFAQFINSDANKSGIQQTLFPGNGKWLNAVLRYDQKADPNDFEDVDDCGIVCTQTDQVGDLSYNVQVDPCLKLRKGEKIDAITLARVCRDNFSWVMRRINILASALEAKIASKFAEDAVALIGKWATDVTPTVGSTGQVLQLATRIASTTNVDPRFPSTLSLAAMKTGYCGPHAIFGSSILWQDTDLLNVGCCSSTGIDLFASLQRYGKTTAWDPYVVAALNGDDRNALMVQLGALQPIFANLGSQHNFEGISGPRATNFEVIPMVTPRYGFPFDLVISNNCGELSYTLETSPHLVAMPLDMFPVGDVMEGVNFVNEIQVTNT